MAKRQELSLLEKIEVLEIVKKKTLPIQVRGSLLKSLTPRSTLTRLINKEEEPWSRWCEVFSHGHKSASLRKGKAPEVGTAQWFGTATS